MTKTIQLLRGTTVQNDAFTGSAGEITVDTQKHELRVHDGSTQGGHIIYTKLDVDTALSSKTNTDMDNLSATGEARFTAKANVALDNLTSTGANIGNWSSNVTNCITEIPQDIKLELNNGTLTLKAGSKVYVPNGVGVFDEVVIENDISTTITNYGSQNNIFVFLAANQTSLTVEGGSNCYSGTTAPTGSTNMNWYDTTNNLLKRTNNSGSTWTSGLSLPISIITSTSNVITSINQVFNGFGYIGSTIFALPGVKALIPDGRNADGTLKNNAFVLSGVKTYNVSSAGTYAIRLSSSVLQTGNLLYNSNDNYNYVDSYIQSNLRFVADVGRITVNSANKIQAICPKTVFHAVDYNDTEYMAHQATPSRRSINITAPASGNSIVAPADGYFQVDGTSTAVGQRLNCDNGGRTGFYLWSQASGQGLRATVPVSKGDSMYLGYTIGNISIKFTYSNGAR